MTLQQTFDLLQTIYEQLAITHNKLEHDCSPETAWAIGNACGTVSKAKALVYRDIEVQRLRSQQEIGCE